MSKQVGLKQAMSIGIGGMVGGGIFAVLGLAVSLAQGGTPLAFLIAGIVALITSYSYAKLSLAYPDKGGTVKFINQAFGTTVFAGSVNNVLWVSYIVMLSLYASAFGSYGPNLISITGNHEVDSHLLSTGIIVIATLINYYSIQVVSKIESYAVIIKLIILFGFIVLGVVGLFQSDNLHQLTFSEWEAPLQVISGGFVIFVAYEGFELIANAASDIKDPGRNVPRAYYYSVLLVIGLYLAIAIVTVGSLTFDAIRQSEEYVLAEAAKPMLGQLGFTIITIAALISTFSAINASLYGGSRVSYEIAEEDELPHGLTSQLWNHPVGLMITATATIALVNLLEVESISTAGSTGFLLVFSIVNFSGFKLSKDINSNKSIHLAGMALCLVALVVLISQQYNKEPIDIFIAIGIIGLCFLGEFIFKKTRTKA